MPWYRNQDQPQYFYVAEVRYSRKLYFEIASMRNAGLVLPIDIKHLVLIDGSNIKLDFSIKYLEEKGLYVIVLL